MAFDQGLVRATACAIVDKLNKSEVTPLDLLDALEQRIAEVDGKVNALPTLCFDRARTHAKALMKKPVGDRGLLAGMPVPIKDLTNVAGVKTTQGSPIYKDRIATQSDVVVERLVVGHHAGTRVTGCANRSRCPSSKDGYRGPRTRPRTGWSTPNAGGHG